MQQRLNRRDLDGRDGFRRVRDGGAGGARRVAPQAEDVGDGEEEAAACGWGPVQVEGPVEFGGAGGGDDDVEAVGVEVEAGWGFWGWF